ncbi:MAG: phage tail tape measure protein [Bacillota bacterium]|nr:phage tail tape measure protein [Bacillota bacterium]
MSKKGGENMAETIKGISVEISGDTTALSAALSDVNKSSRNIQSELKQVEKLLKLDPTNTELLAQRQQLLTNAVDKTREKLDRLKAAQEQVNEQFARGEISEGQYRAFQREVAATEQRLESFEDQLRSANPALQAFGTRAEEVGESFSNVGEKIKSAGEKMSVGVTAPIVAAGGVMLKGAIDAENAQGKLQASLGITADAAADLEAVAQAVWINGFGENIGEVNDTIITVRKNMGDLAEDEMQKVSEAAMTIATLFGADVADTTKTAGTLMKNFGMNSQEAMDLITVGFQKGGDYSGELLDTLNEYSPQFKSMGLSADQMMGILISGAQAGAFNLDKVGDSVKEFNIRAQDGSKTTADGFAAIGLNAQEMGAAIAKGGEDGQKAFTATVAALAAMKDPVQQNIAGTALFGTQWEDVRKNVITAMADGVKGVGDFKGASDSAATAMNANNPGLAITKALREVQLAIGPALLPLADIIKNTIAPAIKELADGFAKLDTKSQKVALAIAGIMAVIGPVLVVIGNLVKAVSTIVKVFSALVEFLAPIGTAIAATLGVPVEAVIAIVAALAAAAYLIITNWGPIKEFFSNLWTSIKTTIITAWGNITQFFSSVWTTITSTIAMAWEGIKVTISNGLNTILAFLQPALTFCQTIFQNAWDIIKNVVLGAVLLVMDIVIGDFTQLKSDLSNIWDNIKTALENIWNAIKGLAETSWNNLKSSVITICTSIINGAKEIWGGLLTWFNELPGKLQTIGSDMFTSMKNGVTNTISGVKSAIETGINSAISWIKSIPGDAVQWGGDIIQGIVRGIKNAASAVGDAVQGVAQDIRAFLHFSVPDKGPLVDYESWMPDFMSGLVRGIEENKYRVVNAMKGLAQGMTVNVNQASAQLQGGNTGPLLHADKIVIANDMDIRDLAYKLEFYRGQAAAARGGA